MNKKNLLIVFVLIFISFKTEVKSLSYGGCEYSEISRLKSLVTNVNITYDYYIQNNRAYFNVTLTNLVPELYFIDSSTNKKYTYANTKNGEITIYNQTNIQSSYRFYSNLSMCPGIKLSTRYYSLPEYNIYYGSDLCSGVENYSLCKKWAKNNYSYDEFKKLIQEYKNKKNEDTDDDKVETIYEKTFLTYFIDFYVDYYYLILVSIIVICLVVMHVNRKKNRFDI